MRIALVTTSFLPKVGGAEFVVHNLAHQWALKGHEVCVFNMTTSVATHADGNYTVRKFKTLRGSDRFGYHRFPFRWYGARVLKRLIIEYKPDFVSAHFGYPVALWLSSANIPQKFLITCHGPALNETPRGPRQRFGISSVLAEAMNNSTGAVAISTHAREVMEKIGVKPSLILDIPNGADVERFSRKVTFDLRAKFNIPEKSEIILSVGRELWAKAYDVGIKAFAKASQSCPNTHYIILGKGVSVWKSMAKELGVKERVILCEGLAGDDLVGTYQQADIFFLPSIKELCPLVVPEAMATGLPAVVTDVSGSQDMIKNNENGFVVPPGDVDSAADALVNLIKSETLRKQFGEINRQKSKDYNWDTISDRYLQYA